jgi:DNA polymerase III sliding clamp (beta) subunit (PCNA family)
LLRCLAVEEGEGAGRRDFERYIAHPLRSYSRIFALRLLTGQFPNYESVLPKENGEIVELNREAFEGVVRRVSLLGDNRLHGVRLALGKS